MTRVFERPADAAIAQTRAVIVGAGAYPDAQAPSINAPSFANLTSVAPGILEFTRRLIRDWDGMLTAPLRCVDLLLSDPAAPNGSSWDALGIPDEMPQGTPIEGATLPALKAAVAASLAGAKAADHFLFLCCGHGFWTNAGRFFVLSDFDTGALDPWESVVALSDFELGLRTQPPRSQWLYFDCCADVPPQALAAFGGIGKPLIQGTPGGINAAEAAYGKLSRFGVASARLGQQAFGLADAPSRFCEMLLEALDGAAAEEREPGTDTWWITDRGIMDAMKSYSQRSDRLDTEKKRKFYMEAGESMVPDTVAARMRFRKVASIPMSRLVATSSPADALKQAAVAITWEGANDACWSQPADTGTRSRLVIDLHPRRTYEVVATVGTKNQSRMIFTHLPLADPAVFSYD
jgi:hypothetical protein